MRYLARPSRRKYREFIHRSRYPSVSHGEIVAWFGPDESHRYYARPSRYKTLAMFPEFVNRQAVRSEVPDGYMGDMYVDNDGVLRPGCRRWPSELLATDLNCEGFKFRDRRNPT